MIIAPPPHNRTSESTDDWITPKWLIDRLGPFDLDRSPRLGANSGGPSCLISYGGMATGRLLDNSDLGAFVSL